MFPALQGLVRLCEGWFSRPAVRFFVSWGCCLRSGVLPALRGCFPRPRGVLPTSRSAFRVPEGGFLRPRVLFAPRASGEGRAPRTSHNQPDRHRAGPAIRPRRVWRLGVRCELRRGGACGVGSDRCGVVPADLPPPRLALWRAVRVAARRCLWCGERSCGVVPAAPGATVTVRRLRSARVEPSASAHLARCRRVVPCDPRTQPKRRDGGLWCALKAARCPWPEARATTDGACAGALRARRFGATGRVRRPVAGDSGRVRRPVPGDAVASRPHGRFVPSTGASCRPGADARCPGVAACCPRAAACGPGVAACGPGTIAGPATFTIAPARLRAVTEDEAHGRHAPRPRLRRGRRLRDPSVRPVRSGARRLGGSLPGGAGAVASSPLAL